MNGLAFRNLTTEAISRIEGADFEEFCGELVRFETNARHQDAEVVGPAKKYTGDAGSDFSILIRNPPRVPKTDFPARFTPDDPCKSCVGCKSGPNWLRLVKKDAKDQ